MTVQEEYPLVNGLSHLSVTGRVLLLIDERWEHRPAERPAWAQLKIWLLDQAGQRSALDQREVAERTAYYVAQMLDAGMAASSLPSADTVVRACLDAIPVSLDHVAVMTDRRSLHALERQGMLDSRRAKNLLNAAERHQADLDDPDLTDRLRAWLAINLARSEVNCVVEGDEEKVRPTCKDLSV